jgi:DNA polymerase III epsilon subunit-like protein
MFLQTLKLVTSTFKKSSTIMTIFIISVALLIAFFLWNNSTKPQKKIYPSLPNINIERYGISKNELNEILHIPKSTNEIPYFIIVDLETTGLIKKKEAHPYHDNEKFPEIVQMGWIVLNEQFELISEQELLIKQKKRIPTKATDIHGITKKMTLENGVEIEEALSIINDDLKNCKVLVCHNTEFDYDILCSAFYRYEVQIFENELRLFCTMDKGIDLCQLDRFDDNFGYKNPTLKELFQRCFFPEVKYLNNFSIKHNALADARIVAACFIKMKTDFRL